MEQSSPEGMYSKCQHEHCGALVTFSFFSERIYRAVTTVEDWVDKLWNVTEFEPGEGFEDLPCTDKLHAVHLSCRGANVLTELCAHLPRSGWYHLAEILDSDAAVLPTTELEKVLVGAEVDAADGKVVRKLKAACLHLQLDRGAST